MKRRIIDYLRVGADYSFVTAAGILWLSALIIPSEGAIREGDFIPVIFLAALLTAIFFFTRLFPHCWIHRNKNNSSGALDDESCSGPSQITSLQTAPSSTVKRRVWVWPDFFAALYLGGLVVSWIVSQYLHRGNSVYAANMFWLSVFIAGVYFLVRMSRRFYISAFPSPSNEDSPEDSRQDSLKDSHQDSCPEPFRLFQGKRQGKLEEERNDRLSKKESVKNKKARERTPKSPSQTEIQSPYRPLSKIPLASVLVPLFIVLWLTAALMESGLSLYSYFVSAPAIRQEFLAHPEETLRASGLYYEKGTPEYALFENRILASSEPLGTYGLTNTLAGLLVPALIFLTYRFLSEITPSVTSFFSKRKKRQEPSESKIFFQRGIRPLIPLLFWIPLAAVLILTKSRAGYLAFFFGTLGGFTVFLIPTSNLRQVHSDLPTTKTNRKKCAAGFIFITLAFFAALALAFHFGFLDKEVFSEAKKSLGYRLDYWTAASRMIADYPLIGCGPGNFQSAYAQYILPTASELIADPHHFAFETAAVFGLPVLIFLAAFLISLLSGNLQKDSDAENTLWTKLSTSLLFSALFGGFAVSFFLTFLTSAPIDPDFFFFFFFPALFVIPLTANFIIKKEGLRLSIPSPLILVILAALLLNLSAAGGFFYPTTALPLWFFAGILANRQADQKEKRENQTDAVSPQDSFLSPKYRRFSHLIIGSVLLLTLAAFIKTSVLPWQIERKILRRNAGGLQEMPSREILEQGLRQGGKDSLEINRLAYREALSAYLQKANAENRRRWQESRSRLLAAAPQSAIIRNELGEAETDAFQFAKRREFLDAAVDSFSEAVRFFPTNASYRARLALALQEAGKNAESDVQAAEALRLDALTPHADRQLPDALRQALTSAQTP